jgi:ABC-2 type transport system permease protein
LLVRDPLTLTFVLVFPIVTMLIIGGSFGTEPDEAFPVNPAHWYVASYFTVVIGATGLIMLPVHIASYRERGVLRRLAAAGFPRWSFAFAQLAMGLTAIVVSGAVLLAVAAPVYGVPAIDNPLRVAAGVLVGSVAFVSIGVLLGTVLPSARSAQAVGLLLFFPSFLLGVGGPPPAVMSPTLKRYCGEAAAGAGQPGDPRALARPGPGDRCAGHRDDHRCRRDDARSAARIPVAGLP